MYESDSDWSSCFKVSGFKIKSIIEIIAISSVKLNLLTLRICKLHCTLRITPTNQRKKFSVYYPKQLESQSANGAPISLAFVGKGFGLSILEPVLLAELMLL